MPIAQATLDGALALVEVLADRDRAKKYLAELRDAGTNAARDEAARHADDLNLREVALEKRERELARLAADLEARATEGAELPGLIRAADVRQGELDSRSAALDDLAAKLNQQAADLQVKERDLERRLAAIRRAAMGAT